MIFGANTDVGKTVFSTALCRNLTRSEALKDDVVAYLKPVSTGPETASDEKCRYTSRVPFITSNGI